MSSIRLKHASGNSMSLAAPGTNPASNLELKLPHTIGSANQLLKVDGSGQLGWADDNSGLTLSNDANNRIVTGTGSGLNAEANLTFDGTELTIGAANTTTGVLRAHPNYFSIDSGYANGGSVGGVVGSATNAALIFGGDANTGLYHSASDTINFTTGGTERLRINANGDINLGNNPTNQYGYKLNIQDNGPILYAQTASSGGTELKLYLDHSNTIANFGTVSTSHLAFVTANTEKVRIDLNGRLLVNTTSASISSSELFEVKSTGSGFSHFRNNSSSYATIYIDNEYSDTGFAPFFTFTDGGGNRGGIGQDQNDLLRITGQGGVSFYTGGTHGGGSERVRINNDGLTGMEVENWHQAIIKINASGTQTYVGNGFQSPSVHWAADGDRTVHGWQVHSRHKSYRRVGFWYGESGNSSGNTWDIDFEVNAAASNQGYTTNQTTFTATLGSFSNGKMKFKDITSSWPSHSAGQFLNINIIADELGDGTVILYNGMVVTEYTNPA